MTQAPLYCICLGYTRILLIIAFVLCMQYDIFPSETHLSVSQWWIYADTPLEQQLLTRYRRVICKRFVLEDLFTLGIGAFFLLFILSILFY